MADFEGSNQRSNDEEVEQPMEELLALLPADVRQELNDRRIHIDDEGFLEAVMDHITRLQGVESLKGRLISGELLQVQKKLKKIVRMQDPDALSASTVRHTAERTNRNDPCPCGSGRKYKKCCINKNR